MPVRNTRGTQNGCSGGGGGECSRAVVVVVAGDGCGGDRGCGCGNHYCEDCGVVMVAVAVVAAAVVAMAVEAVLFSLCLL